MKKTSERLIFNCLIIIALFSLNACSASNDKLSSPKPPAQAKSETTGKDMDEARLKNAEQYLHTKNYDRAKEIYREIFLSVQKGPVAERALLGLGKADYYLKHDYEVVLNMQRFFTLYKDSQYLNQAFLLLAETYLHMQKYKEAGQYFEKVGGDLTEKAIIGEARIALHFDDVAKSDSLLAGLNRKVLESDPGALYVRAKIYSKKGMHKEAVNTVNRILDAALKEQDIRVEKAWIYLNAQKVKEAERLCKEVLNNPASNFEKLEAEKVMLKIYENDGRADDALKLALELAPYEPGDDFKARIVSLYDKKGDSDNAMRYLSYLRNKASRSLEIGKRLKGLIDSGNTRAVEYILKYSQYVDVDSPLNMEISKYLILSGRKKEGMALLKRTRESGSSGEAALYLAEQLIGDGNYAEAKKILDGLKFDMRYLGKTAILLSGIMEREGNYEGAIEYLLKTVKIEKDRGIYAALGDLYWKTGNRAMAVKYYVAASDMKDSASSIRAGDCYYLAGDARKAMFYYKRALNSGVKDIPNLQWAQYQYGKLTNDKDYIQKAVKGGGEVGAAAATLAGEEGGNR